MYICVCAYVCIHWGLKILSRGIVAKDGLFFFTKINLKLIIYIKKK